MKKCLILKINQKNAINEIKMKNSKKKPEENLYKFHQIN